MGVRTNFGHCMIYGCENDAKHRGMCVRHYRMSKKYGHPEAGNPAPGYARDFIKFALGYGGKGCLVWPFNERKHYITIQWEGKWTKVHRVICTLAHGPAPTPTSVARHKCRYKNCVNPRHLQWGEPSDNSADMLRDGTRMAGEKAPWSKITEAQAIEIKQRAISGEALAGIAREFGVSKSSVSAIKLGKTWAHLHRKGLIKCAS